MALSQHTRSRQLAHPSRHKRSPEPLELRLLPEGAHRPAVMHLHVRQHPRVCERGDGGVGVGLCDGLAQELLVDGL
jgi:hypothetical protein